MLQDCPSDIGKQSPSVIGVLAVPPDRGTVQDLSTAWTWTLGDDPRGGVWGGLRFRCLVLRPHTFSHCSSLIKSGCTHIVVPSGSGNGLVRPRTGDGPEFDVFLIVFFYHTGRNSPNVRLLFLLRKCFNSLLYHFFNLVLIISLILSCFTNSRKMLSVSSTSKSYSLLSRSFLGTREPSKLSFPLPGTSASVSFFLGPVLVDSTLRYELF